MQTLPELTEMLKAGMHYGHRTSRWHPKMKPFIFGARRGIHIIDLEQTRALLDQTLRVIKEMASRGGVILFVGTKPQARALVRSAAESCDMPYVVERWLGGTLTNFRQIKESIKRLKMLKDQQSKGELKKYTKKEQLMFEREIVEMEKKLGGIERMNRPPELMFVVGVQHERTAVREANVVGTKVIALCDTNSNPEGVHYIIPSNDDGMKTIRFVCELLAEAIQEGKKAAVTTEAA